MNVLIRPPPKVLFLHDGHSVEAYVSYLINAGLQASEAHVEDALVQALAVSPDIIVLDFDCNGETMAALQADARTRSIPVIAMTQLASLADAE